MFFWRFFRFFRFVPVCFDKLLFVSVVSIHVRNTETNRKKCFLVSRNRLSFSLFRFEPKKKFDCFEDTPDTGTSPHASELTDTNIQILLFSAEAAQEQIYKFQIPTVSPPAGTATVHHMAEKKQRQPVNQSCAWTCTLVQGEQLWTTKEDRDVIVLMGDKQPRQPVHCKDS